MSTIDSRQSNEEPEPYDPEHLFWKQTGNNEFLCLNFYVQDSLPDNVLQYLGDSIVEHGGKIVETSVPSRGYVLVDPKSNDGLKLMHEWQDLEKTPDRHVLSWTFVPACIAAQKLLKPNSFKDAYGLFLDDEDDSMITVYLDDSIHTISTKSKQTLSTKLAEYGANVVSTEDDAQVILCRAGPRYNKLLKKYPRSDQPAIELTSWVHSCITSKKVSFTPKKSNPVKKGNTRNEYTPKDDEHLVEFLGTMCPEDRPYKSSRAAQNLYKRLVTNLEDYPWSTTHTNQSWRKHYLTNRYEFDKRIAAWLKRQEPQKKNPDKATDVSGGQSSSKTPNTSPSKGGPGQPSPSKRKRGMLGSSPDTIQLRARKKPRNESEAAPETPVSRSHSLNPLDDESREALQVDEELQAGGDVSLIESRLQPEEEHSEAGSRIKQQARAPKVLLSEESDSESDSEGKRGFSPVSPPIAAIRGDRTARLRRGRKIIDHDEEEETSDTGDVELRLENPPQTVNDATSNSAAVDSPDEDEGSSRRSQNGGLNDLAEEERADEEQEQDNFDDIFSPGSQTQAFLAVHKAALSDSPTKDLSPITDRGKRQLKIHSGGGDDNEGDVMPSSPSRTSVHHSNRKGKERARDIQSKARIPSTEIGDGTLDGIEFGPALGKHAKSVAPRTPDTSDDPPVPLFRTPTHTKSSTSSRVMKQRTPQSTGPRNVDALQRIPSTASRPRSSRSLKSVAQPSGVYPIFADLDPNFAQTLTSLSKQTKFSPLEIRFMWDETRSLPEIIQHFQIHRKILDKVEAYKNALEGP